MCGHSKEIDMYVRSRLGKFMQQVEAIDALLVYIWASLHRFQVFLTVPTSLSILNMASGLQVPPLPGYKKRRLQWACDICKHKKSKVGFQK